jgi:hypothetical protein
MKTGFLLAVLLTAPRLDAQIGSDTNDLLNRARAATEQFTDRKAAIAAGYRRAGRDLPSMGEHWINPRILMDGGFDPAKPAVLTYLPVDGRAVLTGVVYAVSLAPGESPPLPFGPDAKWHEHNGAIDDEALLPEHETTASAANGTRVAFLHAWLRIPAPYGLFSAENWAIPFIRAGVSVPHAFPNGAARAVSLAGGGKEFFLDLIGSAAAPRISAVLDDCSSVAAKIVAAARSSKRELTQDELSQLDLEWTATLRRISELAGDDAAARINGGAAGHHH